VQPVKTDAHPPKKTNRALSRCSVVFFLSDLNRDITCAQALREQALQELVPQVLALQELVLRVLALRELVPQVLALLLLLSLQAQAVSFLVRTDSQPTRTKMLLTSAPKA
jgi:hypothetical protein